MMLVLLFQSSSYVQIVAYTILMCLKKKKKKTCASFIFDDLCYE